MHVCYEQAQHDVSSCQQWTPAECTLQHFTPQVSTVCHSTIVQHAGGSGESCCTAADGYAVLSV
eukprot:21058-Heterococcus_DN1.PRE.2